ncbi:alpha/beta fold hydrolase [Hugenholtzia roseola]|uniref:alpha/beta fold hydrolase n=1 Tax=Hugenholtzia roseola TaxID=1002 RepID=UPI00040348CA|nr:alpha/beta hydrolase [Hugenholtzia roseola]
MKNLSANQILPFTFFKSSQQKAKKYLIFFGGLGQQAAHLKLQTRYPDRHLLIFTPHFYEVGKVLEKREIQLCLSNLFDLYQIQTFTLLGYSLGSRLAMEVALLFPEKVEKLTLLAPDGILPNFWYRAATSFWGSPLFQIFLKLERNKHFFSKLILSGLDFSKKLGGKFLLFREVLFFLQSEKKTQELENQWLLYAKIEARENRKQLFPASKNKAAWQGFETELIVAESDALLFVKKFKKWQKKRPYIQLKIIKASHLGLWKQF